MDSVFFDLPKVKPAELSPAVWAYIGDAVYETYIRNLLISHGPAKTGKLHSQAVKMVKASFQAGLLMKLEPDLTDAEFEIVKRGRNVKTGHVPPGVELLTYRHSTAFEALIGYLYLDGARQRLNELLDRVMQLAQEN